ncbi:MAG: hypothetical protein ACREXU_11585 [Gammaproteobacteria bacterium]
MKYYLDHQPAKSRDFHILSGQLGPDSLGAVDLAGKLRARGVAARWDDVIRRPESERLATTDCACVPGRCPGPPRRAGRRRSPAHGCGWP